MFFATKRYPLRRNMRQRHDAEYPDAELPPRGWRFPPGKLAEEIMTIMNRSILAVGSLCAVFCLPLAAHADETGAAAGAATGAVGGAIVGGPVGAVVGGAAGAVVGGIASDQRPRFHEYVVREHRPSYRYEDDVRVGAVLPSNGVQYYEAPAEFGARQYRYAIVNDRTVLVDPRTHRIVEVID
jgi:hypothetical protein